MARTRKYYVVWVGHAPGVYDNWDECRAQVESFPGARYKAYNDKSDAIEAFRGPDEGQMAIFRGMMQRRTMKNSGGRPEAPTDFGAHPEIVRDAIAVDGACSGVPGPIEYRGVDVVTGAELFHVGPLADGTNNVAEYLALVHALALLKKQGNSHTAVYSDSRTALSWLRARHHRSKLERTPANATLHALLERADHWLCTNAVVNPVLKWDTDSWGEIPADFDRK